MYWSALLKGGCSQQQIDGKGQAGGLPALFAIGLRQDSIHVQRAGRALAGRDRGEFVAILPGGVYGVFEGFQQGQTFFHIFHLGDGDPLAEKGDEPRLAAKGKGERFRVETDDAGQGSQIG